MLASGAIRWECEGGSVLVQFEAGCVLAARFSSSSMAPAELLAAEVAGVAWARSPTRELPPGWRWVA